MTEAQKETLKFYTTNDYLLINGLLWGEDEKTIDIFINLINADGRGVMTEAEKKGFEKRWNCSKEEGERLYRIYQRRFPVIENSEIKNRILAQAKNDIENMFACLTPISSDLTLYRNIKTKYISSLEEGMTADHPGFSSCSLNPHTAENASYGSSGCTLAQIFAPKGTPAIRLDLMPDVRNEPDEVILAPGKFTVTKIDKESGMISMTAIQ